MMYIFLAFLAFLLIIVPIFIYREIIKSKKLKEEKEQGLWDYIEYEFLPYLASHQVPVQTLENINLKLAYRSKSWTLPGALHYNPAGIYVKFDNVSFQNAPSELFIWGKDKPSRFKPAMELFVKEVETSGSTVVLKLKTKMDLTGADYVLTIKDLPPTTINELTKIFNTSH